MKKFNKLNVTDRKLNQIQDSIVDALDPLLALPLSNSNLIQNQALVSGANIVNHGLQRNLIGWFITRKNADQSVYDTQDTNPTPELTLTLVSSGTVNVDLIVF